MTSKRNLEREVDELSEEAASSGTVFYVFNTANFYDTPKAAPRPKLVVPDSERDGYKTATPSVVPEAFESDLPILFLSEAVIETWEGDVDDASIPVSELWDGLTDEQLREEYETRKANDEPIPPLLEQYA